MRQRPGQTAHPVIPPGVKMVGNMASADVTCRSSSPRRDSAGRQYARPLWYQHQIGQAHSVDQCVSSNRHDAWPGWCGISGSAPAGSKSRACVRGSVYRGHRPRQSVRRDRIPEPRDFMKPSCAKRPSFRKALWCTVVIATPPPCMPDSDFNAWPIPTLDRCGGAGRQIDRTS